MAPEGIPTRPPLPLELLPLSCCDGEWEESDPSGAFPGAFPGAGDGEGTFASGLLTASGDGEGDGDEEGDGACCGDWWESGPASPAPEAA
ncbi:hypothetical protein [Streptomyces sp. NRRL S-1813]|uniref:hypothetical protein n=1 Tax=Streptomyces sp. NRRL S-1813 TaxID=1463888 RepID=UPI0004CB6FBF|nr:hypothetical protein [Streptomyces sp. NRRL S-1813]